jgi:hypothetical protein
MGAGCEAYDQIEVCPILGLKIRVNSDPFVISYAGFF